MNTAENTQVSDEPITTSATSPGQEVKATVDSTGSLLELSFPNAVWKFMSSDELCAVIVRTVEEARQEAAQAEARKSGPPAAEGHSWWELVGGQGYLSGQPHSTFSPGRETETDGHSPAR